MKAPMKIKGGNDWHGEVIFADGRAQRCHFDPNSR